MPHREEAFPLFRLRTAVESLIARTKDTTRGAVWTPIRTPIIALLVALGYFAGSQIGFLLTPADSPIATFWPPNAILLAALLITPRRIWWVLILAVLPPHFLIQLRAGVPVVSAVAWFIGNSGEALLGAVSVRIFKGNKPLLESVRGVIVFLISVILVGGLIARQRG